jgi:predicted esterase
LAEKLQLPETACISLRGTAALPFDLEGYHWGDDIIFDQSSGEMDLDTGFKRANKLLLNEIIQEGLVGKCGYKLREILLFGFGQGGMAALSVAAELGGEVLGGVVSIGGVLPDKAPVSEIGKKIRTPVILCKGNRNSAVKESNVRRLKDTFEFLEVKEWKKVGDGMPSNRDEMMPIMQFFARRLKSTKGVPEGSIEIG